MATDEFSATYLQAWISGTLAALRATFVAHLAIEEEESFFRDLGESGVDSLPLRLVSVDSVQQRKGARA